MAEEIEESEEQVCPYVEGAICTGSGSENAADCLECLASGMSNIGRRMVQVLNSTILPYRDAKALVVLEMKFTGAYDGFVSWLLENSQHPTRRAYLLEAIEQQKQGEADMQMMKSLFEDRGEGR